MSVFFTDSNCELTLARAEELNINFIKMPYTVDGKEEYYDYGKNIDVKAFYKKMRDGAVSITSALNQFNYVEIFEPYLAKGEDILYLSFTHKMSGTFQFLAQAIEELKGKYPNQKITVVDTKHISIPAGMIVYYAKKLHEAKKSDEEIVKFVEDISEKIACTVTVEDLKYLKRGGRLSAAAAFFGTILNVKPIIRMEDGKLVSVGKTNGRKAALRKLVDMIENPDFENYPLVLGEADCKDDMDLLIELIKEKFAGVKIDMWVIEIGPVICSHCGPGTINLNYVKKSK